MRGIQFHIITLVNYTSDQFSGFKNIVVTGTLRDSLVVLEGLLNQETGLHPKELMTDTASYSDVMFGLFHLLGYQSHEMRNEMIASRRSNGKDLPLTCCRDERKRGSKKGNEKSSIGLV